ncbi:MAG TPA: ABC transporter ATP-binding protein [Chromatiaceae bacterium]|jgi:putative phosphonate transport system ATP-binding protein|nr:MAG: phosphonate C-P lyase [Thiohalocapsa sp. PB-PSB1]QQO57186.1 MAG: ABC transporter ATP-binding protein [Thiohalocapsa sp. PB-PSB1]HBG94116.1 ABC transporter ATP-binding protein [Chromatiaceae bacterium]HCS89882.1 ABC transporter ATP-binding protein [Chromatiaceae bacterium]
MDRVLEVRGLSKRYGKGCPSCFDKTGPDYDSNICPDCGSVVAAQDVCFDLYTGEILGIMGESGSGKSTAVKCLYFDQEPTAGNARFYDQGQQFDLFSLNKAQQRRLSNQRFGMVYQNPHLGLNFDISAGGNIAERLLMSDVDNYAQIRQRATALLSRTEVLPERMDELPKNFSGGMQQRVQIAKALATQPPLLFLDEVTTGLDLSVQAAILDLILEIQQQLQTAMIVVTHDLGVIRLLADRTLVMKCGQVIENGLTDQILEDPQQAYTQRLVASVL